MEQRWSVSSSFLSLTLNNDDNTNNDNLADDGQKLIILWNHKYQHISECIWCCTDGLSALPHMQRGKNKI